MTPRPDELDDNEIADRVASGDRDLFSVLIRRHQKAVFSMGIGFFRNEADAGDFTQEVFLKAYKSIGTFKGRARFSTWLYRIAYNTAVNSITRRKEYQSLAEDCVLIDDDSPERQTLRKAAAESVLEAVQELPERYRVCLDLVFFHDLSYMEVEQITGFPVNTIKSHVFRAKNLLRERLGDYAEGAL